MYKVKRKENGGYNTLFQGTYDECINFTSKHVGVDNLDIVRVPKLATEDIPQTDNINPHHYRKGKIECIDAIESATTGKTGFEGALVANIIKYLWRYEEKNGLEDVKKTQWYINKLIQVVEEREENND